MALPQVVSEDLNAIMAEMVVQWESATGKTLYPAQIERLMIDFIAYREFLIRAGINDTARQGLVDFAREPMLSFLGARVDTYRLQPQPARTTLRYAVSAPVSTALVIPNRPRIAAETGVLFVPQREPVIQPGQSFVDVPGQAEEAGFAHNGYLPGTITEAFDDLPDGVTVSNLTTTSNGADEEDIERFRLRVKLANARPGAGSEKQYRYIAMSVSVNVIDVSLSVVSPGHVRLALLLPPGMDPAELLAAVYQQVQRNDIRPTTDHVDVIAGTPVALHLLVIVTPRRLGLPSQVQSAAEASMKAFAARTSRKLGYDIVASEIESLVQPSAPIKRVVVIGANAAIGPTQYAQVTYDVQLTEAEDD